MTGTETLQTVATMLNQVPEVHQIGLLCRRLAAWTEGILGRWRMLKATGWEPVGSIVGNSRELGMSTE
ncbi:MAG: hypothetical protein M1325_06705 [Actinobacteria bacterium]|nr:hypothetical protein [Actinomycetota bacterium]